jgi:thiamine-phosphate pyrophosphorylase
MESKTKQQAPKPDAPRIPPRLYLVTPPVADVRAFLGIISGAFANADVAAVLLQLGPADERTLINRVKAVGPPIQSTGAALIVEGHPEIIAHGSADGAHLADIEAFEEAVSRLKPERIAGVGGLHTRHDAMTAAERGADYVMFGEPDADGKRPSLDAVLERVAWWSEVFEIPCVAWAGSMEDIAELGAAGADFVAVGDFVFADPRGLAAALADAMSRLSASVPA